MIIIIIKLDILLNDAFTLNKLTIFWYIDKEYKTGEGEGASIGNALRLIKLSKNIRIHIFRFLFSER